MIYAKQEQLGISGIEETGKIDMKDLHPIELRVFEARAISIIAEKITVNVSGKKKPVIGSQLYSENNKNPKPLEIEITTEGKVLQHILDPNTLVISEGIISVSGEKEFKELKDFQKNEGELAQLPVRDPDITKIDGSVFRQTGSLQVNVVNATIILTK